MQQGKYVAKVIDRRLRGKSPPTAVPLLDPRALWRPSAATALWPMFTGFWLSGFVAWLAWLFVHIMYLAKFDNRPLGAIQWFGNYVSRNRTAWLITGQHALRVAGARPRPPRRRMARPPVG